VIHPLRHLARSSGLALALATAAPLASAQGAPASVARPLEESLQGAAKDAYASAKILFNNQDFEGAVSKYSQAYALAKDPRLLFNLAICEKNLRHYARTQSLLEQYEHDMGSRIAADDKATVDAALVAIHSLVGSVTLSVNEAGATVSIDGHDAGTTPLAAAIKLDLGKHNLTVKKDGFATYDKTLDVAGGAAGATTVRLEPETHAAHLLVLVEPGATVTIDDASATQGRFDGKVASGVHRVVVTESGKTTYRAEVDLKDGETRSVPWAWIAGGAVVVVAGATVGGYFLFKGQPQAPAPPDQLGSLQLLRRR
jgi:PEGA domain